MLSIVKLYKALPVLNRKALKTNINFKYILQSLQIINNFKYILRVLNHKALKAIVLDYFRALSNSKLENVTIFFYTLLHFCYCKVHPEKGPGATRARGLR